MDSEYTILVDSDLSPHVEGVVAFGDFTLRSDADPLGVVYPIQGGLASFYNDLLLGRPFPLVLATRSIGTLGQLFALALFTNRELALHPRMGQLVWSVTLVDAQPLVGLAHIEPELRAFFKLLESYLPSKLKRDEQQQRLRTAVEWVREYVESGELPALPRLPGPPDVIEHGTGGFVAAQLTAGTAEDAWVWLFRQGFLWGVVFGKPREGRRTALGGHKSAWCPLVPEVAVKRLNDVESAMHEPPEWTAGDHWLWSPKRGTLLPPESVIQVLIVR